MKIKRVECEQFGGISGRELEFDSGLNLIVGNNESGKSTMADLIYFLLFKDAGLSLKSDGDFIDKYFPKNTGEVQADFAEGTLVFETESGRFKLRKEWEKGSGNAKLTMPDGTSVKSSESINEILTKELAYRGGVYDEIVFDSQKRSRNAIESIMREMSKKTDKLLGVREDLSSTITRAALETGGVSIEKIEKELKKRLHELVSHFDIASDLPEGGVKRGITNEWKQEVGEILKAYYEMERLRQEKISAEKAEFVVEAAMAQMSGLREKKKEAEEELNLFRKYSGLLGQVSLLKKNVQDTSNKISEAEAVKAKWPTLSENLKEAEKLGQMRQQAAVHEMFIRIRSAKDEYLSKKVILEGITVVDADDIKALRDAISGKKSAEGSLLGMNLIARVTQLGEKPIEITAVSDDRVLLGKVSGTSDLTDGANGISENESKQSSEIEIKEAVSIHVPGIMEMELVPGGIDVDAVRNQIKKYAEIIADIFSKYDIDSLEELEKLSEAYKNAKLECDRAESTYTVILGGNDYEGLEATEKEYASAVSKYADEDKNLSEADLVKRIAALCGNVSVEGYIGATSQTLKDYETRYGSVVELEAIIERLKKENEENNTRLGELNTIPDKYIEIADTADFELKLQNDVDDCETKVSQTDELLREALRKLGEKSSEEYRDELADKEAVFVTKKKEYADWLNIYNTFIRMKENTGSKSTKDIEDKFKEYLEVISGGRIKLADFDENMSVKLISANHNLTYDILSKGSADTISLAFRLAMLEHLYPDGGGLAVFDDPFVDMDPERTEQACKLVEKFAKNNQVIFITCDSKYAKLMDGNVIKVS